MLVRDHLGHVVLQASFAEGLALLGRVGIQDVTLFQGHALQIVADFFQGDAVAVEFVDKVLVISSDVSFGYFKLDIFGEIINDLKFAVLQLLHLFDSLLLRFNEHIPQVGYQIDGMHVFRGQILFVKTY